MKSIWTMGEMIVEIMRAKSEVPHSTPGEYLGPYASGAPAIMISAAARMGVPAGIIGGVGRDAFGDVIVNRLTGRKRGDRFGFRHVPRRRLPRVYLPHQRNCRS